MTIHNLKIHPAPFHAVWAKVKHHEVRVNDRDYQVGDILFLREWNPETEKFSGDLVKVEVTYMTIGGTWGLPENICIMSIQEVERSG